MHGVTFATVLKSAWAILLAAWSGRQDVTFGHLVSGRANDFPGVDRVIGPCLSLVPVRVTLETSQDTLRLLRQVHDQHIKSTPFEHVGFGDIVRSCTDWPRWARLSSIVIHQNTASGWTAESFEDPDSTNPEFSVPLVAAQTGYRYETSLICPEHDSEDLAIITYPEDDRKVKVTMSFCRRIMDSNTMQTVLDMLCAVIVRIGQSTEDSCEALLRQDEIAAVGTWRRLPFGNEENVPSGDLTTTSSTEALARNLWNEVGLAHEQDPDKPFFDTSGDILPAVEMVELLRQRYDVQVTVEEMIKDSTIRGLAARLREAGI